MTETDKRLDKIQKLLAKAERTNHPEEAAAFTAKAQELMTLWAVDDAMLQAARKGAEPEKLERRFVDIDYSPYQTPHEQLLMVVCRTNDVEVVFTKVYDFARTTKSGRGYQQVSRAHLFGHTIDLDFATMLYTSLLLQAEREFRTDEVQFRMKMETSHPGHRIKWRNSFNQGFAHAVAKRLKAAKDATLRQAETIHGTGMALALIDRRTLVKASVADAFPRLRTKQANAGGVAGGQSAGVVAGNRADLGGKGVGSAPKGALR